MKTIITILAMLGGNCFAAERVVESEASKAAAVQVETGSGRIRLEAAAVDRVTAVVTGEFDEEKCELTSTERGGRLTLTLKGRRRYFWADADCRAGFDIKAPPATLLSVKTGSGGVEVGAFTSGAEITSGAGAVKFDGLSGPVRLASGAGSVSGRIYSEYFSAMSGAGTLSLDWTKAPVKGEASVKSGAGAVRLGFPAGSRLKVNCRSGAGSVNNEIGSDPSAPFSLDVKSGAGSVELRRS